MLIDLPSDRVADIARTRIAADLVGYATGLCNEAILGRSTVSRPVNKARQLVMYLLSQAFAMSLARIASAVGRDRSTVGYSMRLVEDLRDNPAFDAWVEALADSLRAAPPPPCDLPTEPQS